MKGADVKRSSQPWDVVLLQMVGKPPRNAGTYALKHAHTHAHTQTYAHTHTPLTSTPTRGRQANAQADAHLWTHIIARSCGCRAMCGYHAARTLTGL